MKSAIICLLVIVMSFASAKAGNFQTTFGPYEAKMNKLINDQINVELKGHYTYLQLSHTFNGKLGYYPKVAKYFRAKSDEEMQHAERFIQYQNQRGGSFALPSGVQSAGVGNNKITACENPTTLQAAFLCARDLEIYVTEKLTTLAKEAMNLKLVSGDPDPTAEASNELLRSQSVIVHTSATSSGTALAEFCTSLTACTSGIHHAEYIELAEMITHEFLGHQIEDTKEIANYYKTLQGFNNDALASYVFDKNL